LAFPSYILDNALPNRAGAIAGTDYRLSIWRSGDNGLCLLGPSRG
jgi:hypothetical protein